MNGYDILAIQTVTTVQSITIRHQDNQFSLIQNKPRPCNCTCREVLEGNINHKYKNQQVEIAKIQRM